MKQILVLCEFATRSGGENSLLAVLPRLASEFQLAVAAPASGPLVTALGELGIEHLCWDVRGQDGKRRSPLELEESLSQLVIQRRPDLLHANSLSMSRLVGRCQALLECPTVGHLRDMLNLSRTALRDIACLDRVLAVSDATRQWFIERELPAAHLFTVHNGVDLECFRPATPGARLTDELDIPADAPLLGAVGQLVQRKGWRQMLDAVATVFDSNPDPHLVIIGDRWSLKQEAVLYEEQLRRQASRLPLAGRVHWLGYREDVSHLLPQFTMLLHTSRQEPLGRVLLEAAASGIPVVATDVGGTAEIFPAETDGALLVNLDNHQQLANAIRRLLGDEELQQQLGRGGRLRAELCFSIPQAAEALASHYRQLLPV